MLLFYVENPFVAYADYMQLNHPNGPPIIFPFIINTLSTLLVHSIVWLVNEQHVESTSTSIPPKWSYLGILSSPDCRNDIQLLENVFWTGLQVP